MSLEDLANSNILPVIINSVQIAVTSCFGNTPFDTFSRLPPSKEFSKALRALHTLTTEPEDSRDEEHTWRLREMSGKLRQLCNQDVGDGEVPNPLKLLQIHLKHILMQSDKVKGRYILCCIIVKIL